MKVKCPGCAKTFEVPREQLLQGVKLKCPQCGRQFMARIKKEGDPPSQPSGVGASSLPVAPAPVPKPPPLSPALDEDLFGGDLDLSPGSSSKETGSSLSSLFEDSDPFATPEKPRTEKKGAPPIPDFDWEEKPGEKASPLSQGTPSPTPPAKPSAPPSPPSPEPSPSPRLPRFSRGLHESDVEQTIRATVVKREEEKRAFPLRPLLFLLLGVVCVAGVWLSRGLWLPLLRSYLPHPPTVEEGEGAPFVLLGSPRLQVMEHRLGYRLLTVSGTLRNTDAAPQSFLELRVVLKNRQGAVVGETTVYAGNVLSEAELTTLPQARIQEILSTETGRALANFNIPPQGQVEFMAVFFNPPSQDLQAEVIPTRSQRGGR